MPTLPTNPHYIGDSGHVNDHNKIVTALSNAVYASGQAGTVDLSGATVKGAGMDLISSQNVSAASAVTFDGVFTSTYRNYKLIYSGIASNGAVSGLKGQFRASGATNTTTNYFGGINYVTNSAGPSRNWDSSIAFTYVGLLADLHCGIDVTIFSPQVSGERTSLFGVSVAWGNSDSIIAYRAGLFNQTGSFDGIYLSNASGTMTGRFSIYGMHN